MPVPVPVCAALAAHTGTGTGTVGTLAAMATMRPPDAAADINVPRSYRAKLTHAAVQAGCLLPCNVFAPYPTSLLMHDDDAAPPFSQPTPVPSPLHHHVTV